MHPIDQIRKFTRMTPEVETSLLNIMRHGTFKKGETIHGANNLSSYVYYIMSGSARIFATISGKDHTFGFAFEDEFLLPSRQAIKQLPDTLGLQFLEPTEILYIPHLRMKDILMESGSVLEHEAMLFLSVALIRQNIFLEERLFAMQTLSAPERYKWLVAHYPRILETATGTQIASYLGISKETLYRIRNNTY